MPYAVKSFAEALQQSKMAEKFDWIMIGLDEDIMYDSVTAWGIVSPHGLVGISSDQEFEDWKCTAASFENIVNRFPQVEIGTFRHGFSLMSCDRCSSESHLEPIMLHKWRPAARHSVMVSSVYGKLPEHTKEEFFLLLAVHGGTFTAYANIPATGGLPIGMLILQPQPFCS